jgi:uncharacterized protein YciI
MRWAAFFTDREDGADIRAAHSAAHQAYLRKYKGTIILAGALRPEPDGVPNGGLWVFEAGSKADVEAIIAEDPFQIHGLRATSEVFAWGTAPGFEDVEIGSR